MLLSGWLDGPLMDVHPEFDLHVGRAGVALDRGDVELLRAVDRTGSLNAATDALGRSYAHAQRRVVELEGAFGELVDRQRGGPDGGGSELTGTARDLLSTFDRLNTTVRGVAENAESVLTGRVVDRDGELATVETAPGEVRALVPVSADRVQLSVRADAVTLTDPADAPVAGGTSARNTFPGTVDGVETGERIASVGVDIGAAEPVIAVVTADSRKMLGLEVGRAIVVSFKATATRGVPAGPDGGRTPGA